MREHDGESGAPDVAIAVEVVRENEQAVRLWMPERRPGRALGRDTATALDLGVQVSTECAL